MELEIAHGVKALIQPTKKFKTILIEYKFRCPYEPAKATARTLLRNVMITNTRKYSTQKEMDKQMSWLYGASLGSHSQRFGNQQVITFRLKIVNDKFIGGDDTLLEQAFTFLNEVVFAPNVEDGQFHLATFNREKQNLTNYFISLEDNKPAYASYRLNQILFEGTDQAYLGMGDEQFLKEITPLSLYQDYQEMIQKDNLDIFISGDVQEPRVQAVLEGMDLQNREVLSNNLFIEPQKRPEVEKKEEAADVNQGTLLLGFSSPVYYLGEDYFASLVFNGLFGGFPHSKLFQNVREKASLAYSASSFFDLLRGTMIIHTGIEFSKKEQVEEIVLQQLEDMREAKFSDELLIQTKEMLINQFKQNDDHQARALAKIYMNRLITGKDFADEEWIHSLQNVTRGQIRSVAQKLDLQALFFLKGDEKTNE